MTAEGGNGGRRPAGRAEPAPESAQEALARAASHARIALSETLAAVRALADAAALAAHGQPIAEGGVLGLAVRSLDELAASLAAGADGPGSGLLRAVSEALDAEIARWEERAQDDAEARAVLRAYLGLREILWEFGVRPAPDAGSRQRQRPTPGRRSGGPRVQRVPIEE